jgi:hypothetical protein
MPSKDPLSRLNLPYLQESTEVTSLSTFLREWLSLLETHAPRRREFASEVERLLSTTKISSTLSRAPSLPLSCQKTRISRLATSRTISNRSGGPLTRLQRRCSSIGLTTVDQISELLRRILVAWNAASSGRNSVQSPTSS